MEVRMFPRLRKRTIGGREFTHYRSINKDHVLINTTEFRAVRFQDNHIEKALKKRILNARDNFRHIPTRNRNESV